MIQLFYGKLVLIICISIASFSLKRHCVSFTRILAAQQFDRLRSKPNLQVKKGQLRETSPLLNDISSVPTWKKVNAGLLRMYKVCQSDTC